MRDRPLPVPAFHGKLLKLGFSISQSTFSRQIETAPAVFWLWSVPFNACVIGAWLLLLLARSRRLVIAGALAQIVIFTIPYWSCQWISGMIRNAYGYA
jgi:hypothetical protein